MASMTEPSPEAATTNAPDPIPSPRLAIIVVAAGSGQRLGADQPKAFVGIDDESILHHCLRGVFAAPPAQVVVVAPEDRLGDALTEARTVAAAVDAERVDLVSVVAGGDTRQASVAAGLTTLWADVTEVLVHDAARALAPADLFARVVDALDAGAEAVVPMLPMVDTVKRVSDTHVLEALDRSQLATAQTPQGFTRAVLESAYRDATADHTDDAALVQAAGHPVAVVTGDERAFKITTSADLDRARALVDAAPTSASTSVSQPDSEPAAHPATAPTTPRVGIGTDVHAFGGEGTLRLAGLEWPGEPALHGHSDGDAVAHAIVDAVLAAAGLGDIGSHFGTDRPEWAAAHADRFLRHLAELVGAAGGMIGNVSVQVQMNRPNMSARRAEAERTLSEALGAPVRVSATTTDGLGFAGAGEGVAAYAVALVMTP